jgi:NADH:ubiquinone reductase (non-electrogenic)
VGTVEFRSILEPVRRRLHRLKVYEAAAERVDWQARTVACRSAVGEDRFELRYDVLVIAVGAAVADYGVAGVFEHALTLKSVEDARAIRRRLLEQFAAAGVPGLDPAGVRRRLTFVVCGGGATGVEVAAEIHDLIVEEIRRDLPELAREARIVLVEALGRILTGFDEALAGYTQEHLRREGVELMTGTRVVRIEPDRVVLDDGELPCGMTVWAGGNTALGFVRRLGVALDDRGRIAVDGHLRLADHPEAFALGDCATVGEGGLPATAQVAQTQGKYLAKALERRRRGKPVDPFRFKTSGMLAYIGGGRALADLPHAKWSGRTAWLFWRSVYLTKLVSLSNKVKVLFDWVKARLFGRDLSRF